MKTKNACPFCGHNTTQVLSPTTTPNTSSHGKGYQVECINCGARGPCGMAAPKDAISVWEKGDPPYERPFFNADSKLVYGAGFHASKKAAQGNTEQTRGSGRGYLNAKNAMLCWNPGTAEVAIVEYPNNVGASNKYIMTALGCFPHVQKMTFDQRKAMVFIEAMHLIVRDGCDPASVHLALLGLEEYRDGCASDMPLMND